MFCHMLLVQIPRNTRFCGGRVITLDLPIESVSCSIIVWPPGPPESLILVDCIVQMARSEFVLTLRARAFRLPLLLSLVFA